MEFNIKYFKILNTKIVIVSSKMVEKVGFGISGGQGILLRGAIIWYYDDEASHQLRLLELPHDYLCVPRLLLYFLALVSPELHTIRKNSDNIIAFSFSQLIAASL